MIDGADEQSRLIRRTLMRYLTLGSLIVFQATSVRIKKRFPTMEHLIEAGASVYFNYHPWTVSTIYRTATTEFDCIVVIVVYAGRFFITERISVRTVLVVQ